MKVKRFRGPSMQEVLSQVRNDMGSNAVILQSRSGYEGGILGVMRREYFEIVASKDVKVRESTEPVSYEGKKPETARCEDDNLLNYRISLDQLQTELNEIKGLLNRLSTEAGKASFPPELMKHYLRLRDQGLGRTLARNLVRRLHDEMSAEMMKDTERVTDRLAADLSGMLRGTEGIHLSPGKAKIIALIGPTGVGKTTTIAKLAGHFRIYGKKKVGLITADTYRIAATEQLKIYAEIIDIPIEIVMSPPEMKKAVNKLKDKDVIFIDTTGGSQFNRKNLQELQAFLTFAGPHETHLLLCANTPLSTQSSVFERFSSIGVDCLIFTKLDETRQLGMIADAAGKINKPLSYFTTGQNVPDDIEVAEPGRLAHVILGLTPEWSGVQEEEVYAGSGSSTS